MIRPADSWRDIPMCGRMASFLSWPDRRSGSSDGTRDQAGLDDDARIGGLHDQCRYRVRRHRRERVCWHLLLRWPGPASIRDNTELVRITLYFIDSGKPVASICHGVEVPARADRVRGGAWRAFPNASSTSKVAVALHAADAVSLPSALTEIPGSEPPEPLIQICAGPHGPAQIYPH